MLLVSIGMPVYNGEKFIREALDSLLAQTFTDFELIISDNASTDSTEAICREYAAKDARIRYIRHSENKGPAANFQFVLDGAVGKYFMWAAADDVWHPTFVAKCCTALENDTSIGFVVTRYTVVSRFNPLLRLRCVPDLKCVTESDAKRRVLSYSSMPFHTHKDNLVYGLWRRGAIAGILMELRQSRLGKILIGASMNEFALSLYRGEFVDKVLFEKRYRFLPPGHVLGHVAELLWRIIRRSSERDQKEGGAYGAEQHLRDLRVVLELALFDERYISQVIDANKYHMNFHKRLRL